MDYLEEKFADFEKALLTLKEAVGMPKSIINRDASLKRFEFTFELFWKTAKVYLKETEGIECASPKSCFREIRVTVGLSEENIEQCMSMANDRNLSVHIYSEEQADILYGKLPRYLETMELIAEKIKEKAKIKSNLYEQ